MNTKCKNVTLFFFEFSSSKYLIFDKIAKKNHPSNFYKGGYCKEIINIKLQ